MGVGSGGRAKGWAWEGAGLRVERGLGRRSERRVGAAEGDLLTMSPICGNSSRAKSTGAVARPWSMSDSAGLPSEAALPTKSRWSSTSCRSKGGHGAQAADALDYPATLTVCAYLVGDAYLLTYLLAYLLTYLRLAHLVGDASFLSNPNPNPSLGTW